MGFLEELEWRGMLHQTAGQDVADHLASGARVAYCGFDPTKESLTIGNFVPIKVLMHWQRAGHKPIVVMGGKTCIGDPSGKDAERQLMGRDQVDINVSGQMRIFEKCLDFDPGNPNAAVMVNNIDWLDRLSFIDMLRDVGKYFWVNVMIQKDSVRDRLHNRDQGISYTEFSYMILQAYDFLHLFKTMNCTVQVAGSDQYGNIVAGMDLIRRESGEKGVAYGITSPLLTTTDGKKIGKTEDGAIWLTPERTSPYRFYQYWINVADDDVIRLLKWFTFLERDQITALEAEHAEAPHRRVAHQTLAREMTTLIHGADELERVEAATAALFGQGDVRALDAAMLTDVFSDVPHSKHDRDSLGGDGVSLVDVLAGTTLAPSKRQAREFVANGAVFVNGEKADVDRRITSSDLLHDRILLLRRGKKSWHATLWE